MGEIFSWINVVKRVCHKSNTGLRSETPFDYASIILSLLFIDINKNDILVE